MFQNKKILLGVTGSIAAYKAPELMRSLQKKGAFATAMATKAAREFVSERTLQILGNWGCECSTHPLNHVKLAAEADLLLVAPASANTIAKMAQGLADEPLLQTYLSFTGPVIVAPAMESNMWRHPATQSNLRILQERGVYIVEPERGFLASGAEGLGRLAEFDRIHEAIASAFSPQDYLGLTVLVTAGPTLEPIDPVRFLSNRSSGKMGIALARALAMRGALVKLVHGPLSIPVPKSLEAYPVENASSMQERVLALSNQCQIAILCAAVADYGPAVYSAQKIKKNLSEKYSLALIPNSDILKTLGHQTNRPFLVGFAAESSSLEGYAQEKLRGKNCDLICANRIGQEDFGIGSNLNEVSIYNRAGLVCALEKQDKNAVANRILDVILTEQKNV
ncbi:MAG: bifunctional phosphopantothenoylcysteine decarboxylase/phosphopantothenate--cysteine ligase CoaBC [Myxococcaceae bacterium]|nr:bifunctional phosphopantothenoylcysteine decarboxylase/phosphopantothenate--cysteine ligase CoaBC [Myxococcaceae bacterium]